MLIHLDSQSYKDEVEITRQQFYERLSQVGVMAQTAAPGPGSFLQAYDRLADEGASQVLSLHLASSLSATYSIAASTQATYSRIQVSTLDTGQLSLGLGFLAERAAREARVGNDQDHILEVVREQMSRTFVFAALDTMEYLRRSGRVNSLVAGLGGALRIKPILKLHNGLATSERVRTASRATQRLVGILSILSPLERVAIVHANAPERADELRRLAGDLLPSGEVITANITPAIGAHVGPGTVGFVVVAGEIQKAQSARDIFQ